MIFRFIGISVVAFGITLGAAAFATEPIYVYSYSDPSCTSCSSMASALATLAERYPEIRLIESDITSDPAQETILYDLLSAYDADSDSLPAVFIGDQSFVGYDQNTVQAIERQIVSCREQECVSPNELLQSYYQEIQESEDRKSKFPQQIFWALFVILWPAAGLLAIWLVWRHFRLAKKSGASRM